MDIINEYFKKHTDWPRPAMECADGFHISVQAHHGAYCTPRITNYEGEYSRVECGFPNGPVPELAEWKDGDDADKADRSTDTDSVYAYVPISAVLALIEKHGGLK